MNRDQATALVLAEAFAEKGMVSLAREGQVPERLRMDALISALNLLADELSGKDHFGRKFVSALVALVTNLPEALGSSLKSDSQPATHMNAGDLIIAITNVTENWDNWPSEDEYGDYEFFDAFVAEDSSIGGDIHGYRVGDRVYCEIAVTGQLFRVCVVRLGSKLIEVSPVDSDFCEGVCKEFVREKTNRHFYFPTIPPANSRGVFDERPVNSDRTTGPELRLLSPELGKRKTV